MCRGPIRPIKAGSGFHPRKIKYNKVFVLSQQKWSGAGGKLPITRVFNGGGEGIGLFWEFLGRQHQKHSNAADAMATQTTTMRNLRARILAGALVFLVLLAPVARSQGLGAISGGGAADTQSLGGVLGSISSNGPSSSAPTAKPQMGAISGGGEADTESLGGVLGSISSNGPSGVGGGSTVLLPVDSKPVPAEVKAITQKVADWQIRTFEDSAQYRAVAASKKKSKQLKWHDLSWQMGALYAGLNEWRKLSGDPEVEAFLMKIGDRNGWKLHQRPYHADDHAVGQFYLSLYEEQAELKMIGPTREQFDWILANPKTGTLEYKAKPTDARNRWGWCDALFMAPPVWARLAKITGEQKYLDFMDQEYHATYDLLWDKEDHLFWRDSSYFSKREANGRKLYWARGNGWVFGGLALMIPDLPKDWEGRQFYIELYKQMAESLKKCQRDDGTWSMGLLGGEEAYPIKETSGTSFNTFGLAWGINNGLLDRAEFGPIVFKAWAALTQCVTDDGLLGHVQPVGAEPGESYADKSEVYGVGAFLMAGSEVYKLVEEVG